MVSHTNAGQGSRRARRLLLHSYVTRGGVTSLPAPLLSVSYERKPMFLKNKKQNKTGSATLFPLFFCLFNRDAKATKATLFKHKDLSIL